MELKDKARLLAQVKRELASLPVVHSLFEELGYPIEILDGISIEFSELDVSAKTIDSKIYLNENLLSESFEVIMRYAVHELTHALQHMNREHIEEDPYADDDYLDRDDELEAFQNQIEYQKEVEGEESAHKYVVELVEYHEVSDGDKKEKIDELLRN